MADTSQKHLNSDLESAPNTNVTGSEATKEVLQTHNVQSSSDIRDAGLRMIIRNFTPSYVQAL